MPSAKELAKALAYRGEIRNTSRNRLLGGVADVLSPVSEFADQYKISDRIPFFGGMSAADLTGLKGAQSLVNDMSYGKSPISGASLQTTKVDPRVLDLAGVSGAMMPVAKSLGKAALKKAAEQIETGTGIGRAFLDPRMSVSHGLLDTTGLENRGRDLIRGKAEELAQRMRESGVTVDLQHSGSAAGPSSYIKVAGMPDIRISGHSKGAFNSGGVLNVASPEEFDNVLAMAIKKQQKYNSQKALMEKMYEDAAIPIRLKSADKKIAKGLKLTNSEQDAVNVRAMPKPIDVGGAMMHRPKTEFEILHDTAQRNAALPKEQGGLGLPANNTYIDRANDPGMFPTDAYHGTTTEIDPSFNLDYSGANALDYGKKNIWATDNPELASQYAEAGLSRNQAEAIQKLGDFNWTKKEEIPDKIAEAMFKDIKEFGSIEGGGANVLPLKLRGKQSLYDAYGGRWKNEIPKALWGRDLENADIAVINNVIDNPTLQKVDPSTVYAISNPANIRSRFAAFDPFRRHEADILAGVGVGGMLDPQAIAEALRQQDRK